MFLASFFFLLDLPCITQINVSQHLGGPMTTPLSGAPYMTGSLNAGATNVVTRKADGVCFNGKPLGRYMKWLKHAGYSRLQ